jgi:predicted metal-dependent phosphoesterase TrpH
MKIDLYSHSYYSDGELSHRGFIRLASQSECDLSPLADHDNTAGLAEAQVEGNFRCSYRSTTSGFGRA